MKKLKAFADFGNDEPCPGLDPDTGGCDLYDARPMTCRTTDSVVVPREVRRLFQTRGHHCSMEELYRLCYVSIYPLSKIEMGNLDAVSKLPNPI